MRFGNLHAPLAVYANNKPNETAVVYYEQSLTFKNFTKGLMLLPIL